MLSSEFQLKVRGTSPAVHGISFWSSVNFLLKFKELHLEVWEILASEVTSSRTSGNFSLKLGQLSPEFQGISIWSRREILSDIRKTSLGNIISRKLLSESQGTSFWKRGNFSLKFGELPGVVFYKFGELPPESQGTSSWNSDNFPLKFTELPPESPEIEGIYS